MTIIPPYLRKGDTVGIVCPAGYMPLEKISSCIETLEQWGYTVQLGKTPGNQFHYFSGTDEERLEDFQQMLDDDNIKAVLCGRGGYGVTRIIDAIDFSRFVKHPKWIIGFSDITALHSHIFSNFHIASLHAPMAAAFNDGEASNQYIQSLKQALEGEKANYTCKPHPLNKNGEATAELVGGNLSLLAHCIGTKSDIHTKGKILFIEDIGEYIYSADRMFLQLKRSGKLDELAGLIIGGFTDMKDTTIPFGTDIYTAIHQHIKDADYPVCFDFPVSHEKENYALKVGVPYCLQVTASQTQLTEQSF